MDTNNEFCGSYGSSFNSLEEVSPQHQFSHQYQKRWVRTYNQRSHNHASAINFLYHTKYQFSSDWIDFRYAGLHFSFPFLILFFSLMSSFSFSFFLFFTDLIHFTSIFLLLSFLHFLLVFSASVYYSDFAHLPFSVSLFFLFLLALLFFSVSAYYSDSFNLSFSVYFLSSFSR